jgi:hypothetical protein
MVAELRGIMVHPVETEERERVAAHLLQAAARLAAEEHRLVEIRVVEVVPGWMLCRMNLSRTLQFKGSNHRLI